MVVFSLNKEIPPEKWKDHPLMEPQVVDASPEDILAEYQGWGSDVIGLLGCIRKASKWNINVISPLKSYVRGRMALVGDAVLLFCHQI